MSQAQIDTLASLFNDAVQTLQADGTLPPDWQNNSQITRTKDLSHGDFASNIALTAAKSAKTNPRQLAEKNLSMHYLIIKTFAKWKSLGLGLSTSF